MNRERPDYRQEPVEVTPEIAEQPCSRCGQPIGDDPPGCWKLTETFLPRPVVGGGMPRMINAADFERLDKRPRYKHLECPVVPADRKES